MATDLDSFQVQLTRSMSASDGKPVSLRLLTLNCWGLRVITKFREERMEAIANEIQVGGYDVVALQELWSKLDFERMIEIIKSMPYSHMFYSGVIGSGLAIFSKYPIVGSYFHAFMSSGGIFDMDKGDVFAGKGVGMCRIKLPGEACHLSMYTSHTYGRYRDSQLFEIMQFIHYTRGRDLVGFCGDLNTYPKMVSLKLFYKNLDLENAFIYGQCDPQNCDPHCSDCHTCDNKGNTFGKVTPKRIDHMFISPKASCGYSLTEIHYKHVLKDPIPDKGYNYSDHVGIEVNVTVVKDEAAAQEILGDFSFIDTDEKRVILQEVRANIEKKKNELWNQNPFVRIEAIKKWIIWHVVYAVLALILMAFVPPVLNIFTNILWAYLILRWLRNFAGHVMELSLYAGVEANHRDICNYLSSNQSSLIDPPSRGELADPPDGDTTTLV